MLLLVRFAFIIVAKFQKLLLGWSFPKYPKGKESDCGSTLPASGSCYSEFLTPCPNTKNGKPANKLTETDGFQSWGQRLTTAVEKHTQACLSTTSDYSDYSHHSD
jgi:hypothetical protein